MKKKCFALAVTVILLLGAASYAMANGYKTWALGARNISKAGAFIGQADDWTAVYFNPAGLSQLQGANASIEPGYLYLRVTDDNSVRNYTATGTAGANFSQLQGDTFLRIYNVAGLAVEPAQFIDDKIVYSNISPSSSAGGYFSLGAATIGFGISTPAGLKTDWDGKMADTVNGALITASFYNSLEVVSYNVSAAAKIGKKASFGIGVNFLTLDTEIKAKKKYEKITPNPLVPNYNFEYREKAHGFGVEPMGGFLYKITDHLQLGGVYRFGAKIKGEGKATGFHTALGTVEDSHYRQTYYYPSSYGIGAAYIPTEKLNFTFDWERTDWHKLNRKLDFDITGILLNDLDIDWEWRKSDQFSFGTEYEAAPWLILRGGIRYDESPQSKNTVSITNVYDIDKLWYTSGISLKKGGFALDVGYGFAYAKDDIRGVKYTLLAHNVVIGGRYNF